LTPFEEKVLEISERLSDAGIPYAIGGALALAYNIYEPRATVDIDVNVFVSVDQADRVFAALPKQIEVTSTQRGDLERDGQVRLDWDDTAVDIFFATVPFHAAAASRVERVEFLGQPIPILSATDLTVCKAVFSRLKDWADIEAMHHAGAVDNEEALTWVRDIVGPDSANEIRLAELLASPVPPRPRGDPILPRRQPNSDQGTRPS
jgi:hypothetical protein